MEKEAKPKKKQKEKDVPEACVHIPSRRHRRRREEAWNRFLLKRPAPSHMSGSLQGLVT